MAPTGRLSERMTAPRNMWGQLWARSRPRAAEVQKPLLDPEAEGEKVWMRVVPLRVALWRGSFAPEVRV